MYSTSTLHIGTTCTCMYTLNLHAVSQSEDSRAPGGGEWSAMENSLPLSGQLVRRGGSGALQLETEHRTGRGISRGQGAANFPWGAARVQTAVPTRASLRCSRLSSGKRSPGSLVDLPPRSGVVVDETRGSFAG